MSDRVFITVVALMAVGVLAVLALLAVVYFESRRKAASLDDGDSWPDGLIVENHPRSARERERWRKLNKVAHRKALKEQANRAAKANK